MQHQLEIYNALVLSMNSKKQTQILSQADLDSHQTSKIKLSIKNFKRTNDIANNVNIWTKKIFNKISKKLPSASFAFSSMIKCKDKVNIQKSLIDRNVRLKLFAC